MNFELNIVELILSGFNSSDRYRVGEAVQTELIRLIGEKGFPDRWGNGVHIDQINGRSFQLGMEIIPKAAGREIARSVHSSLNKILK